VEFETDRRPRAIEVNSDGVERCAAWMLAGLACRSVVGRQGLEVVDNAGEEFFRLRGELCFKVPKLRRLSARLQGL
jgi:hypothetical protein